LQPWKSHTLRSMRTAVRAARGPGFTISAVTCHDDHAKWSSPEIRDGYNLVLARRGRFRRRADGICADIDPILGYVGVPGAEEQFAHPAGGDACTWIKLEPQLWATLASAPAPLARSTFYVHPQLDLSHRRVLAATRTGDPGYALTEQLLSLFSGVLQQITAGPAPARSGTRHADRTAVTAARAAIQADHPAAQALIPLAALLSISPFRLSRAFSTEMGVSLTRYRNHVRLKRVLDRLEEGEDNLAVLAADLRFADQAHLCRTVRQHLGHTPTALRRLLNGSPSD
jgi:AraC-like DNA-binding protein